MQFEGKSEERRSDILFLFLFASFDPSVGSLIPFSFAVLFGMSGGPLFN